MTHENHNEVPVSEETEPQPPAKSSTLSRVFRNRFGQWRAGWRIVVYGILTAALIVPFGFLAAGVARSYPGAGFISWTRSVTWLAGDLALILAAVLVLRFFDRRPVAMLGLGFTRGWLRELAAGLLAGVGITGFLVLVLIATGSVKLELAADPAASFSALPLLAWIFLVAGTLEELLFRGYLMQALSEGSRRWIAGLVTSLVFTWAHVDNPDVTFVGVSNIFLAGVILAVLYFRTQRLWLPIGFHVSWNLAQSWLWGFDVSGIKITDQLFVMTPSDADLVTGGEFGLEGSILSTAFFVLLIGWVLWKKYPKPAPEVATMWLPYPTGFGCGGRSIQAQDNAAADGELVATARADDPSTSSP